MKKKLFTICMLLCGCLWVSAQSYQEVVYLKNGSIIKGVIVEQIPNVSLKVKTADGSIFAYQISEVEKLTKEEVKSIRNHSRFYSGKKHFNTDKTRYKGFFELGGAIGIGDYGDGVFTASTTHGYQFNPYFFLGAGIGADYHFDWETLFIPIFADVRANIIDGKVTPYVGMKVGYSIFDGIGFYFNPNVGVSCALSPKLGLNVSLGYNLQKADIYYFLSAGSTTYSGVETETIGGVTIKLGLEF